MGKEGAMATLFASLFIFADAIYLLAWLFLGGPEPPEPFPGCGVSPDPGSPGCSGFQPCPAP